MQLSHTHNTTQHNTTQHNTHAYMAADFPARMHANTTAEIRMCVCVCVCVCARDYPWGHFIELINMQLIDLLTDKSL